LTVQPTRPTRPHREVRDDWGRVVYYEDEPADRRFAGGYVVAFLMLLALIVLCITGFLLIRVLMPDRSTAILPAFVTWTPSSEPEDSAVAPTASPPVTAGTDQATVAINPQQGAVNTLVTVTGEGWWPGEPVFVFLRSQAEGDGRGYSYAAAVAEEDGSFRTALTFPNEMRWFGQEWADVIARGTRSHKEASTRFTLLAPTPTDTPPPPTPRPTLAATDTPVPTSTPLPTETPLPTPTPEAIITDWRGEYFVGTIPSGEPVLVRNDVRVDFNWGLDSPGEGIPPDGFAARWTRRLYFDQDTYRFTVVADDGVRFWIDGWLVLDEWHDSSEGIYVVDIPLPAGDHALHLEFYENLGGALAYLDWERIEPATVTPEPTSSPAEPPTLTPEPTVPLPTDAWWAEYYKNADLKRRPVLSRWEPALSYDWGTGSPAEGVPDDFFSARWTREIVVPASTYRFSIEADDGARLWVDGELLINAWPATIGEIYAVEVYLPSGAHILTVEYFEETVEARIHFWSEAVH
jgi:hypothetical protein